VADYLDVIITSYPTTDRGLLSSWNMLSY